MKIDEEVSAGSGQGERVLVTCKVAPSKQDNYEVIRDKHNLEYKGFISDFIGEIGQGKCVVVAISQKYVRSPFCMFELFIAALRSND